MKLSAPQQRLINRMSHGAKLYLDHASGKYTLFDGAFTQTVSPATIKVLQTGELIDGTISGKFNLRLPE